MIKLKQNYNQITVILILSSFIALISSTTFAQPNLGSAKIFAETNGIAYQWFPIEKMLVMRQGLKSVRLKVNNPIAIVDGKEYRLPHAPQIRDGQIMIPIGAVTNIFRGIPPQKISSNNVVAKPTLNQKNELLTKPPRVDVITQNHTVTNPITPPPAAPPVIALNNQQQAKSVLVALRHSIREDQTRVVLEFSGNVLYKEENKKNIFRLRISGCKNLIPTNRTNPVGRDIEKVSFNSGPNRQGLVITFKVKDNTVHPRIETVANPFRMVIFFPKSKQNAEPVATTTVKEVETTTLPKKEDVVAMEKAPEINIEVPVASISNSDFLGRTIVIDAGHGGSDFGISIPGKPPEKEIVFNVAQFLKTDLEKMGFKGVLTRSHDSEVSQQQRRSIANRLGCDLFISLHCGGSADTTKSGPACYTYSTTKAKSQTKDNVLSYQTICQEWQSKTRFDLASFLAKKIDSRLTRHLEVTSRGIKRMPMYPLKLIVSPAVLVEIGMLSDKTEGKNLISKGYQKAIAQSIANGVVDFFNGIVIKK